MNSRGAILGFLTSTLVTGWIAVGHDHDEKNDAGDNEKNDDEAADEKNDNDWLRWGTECTAETPYTRVRHLVPKSNKTNKLASLEATLVRNSAH